MDRDSPDICAREWGTCLALSETANQHVFHMCNEVEDHVLLHRCGDCNSFTVDRKKRIAPHEDD